MKNINLCFLYQFNLNSVESWYVQNIKATWLKVTRCDRDEKNPEQLLDLVNPLNEVEDRSHHVLVRYIHFFT